MKISIHIQQKFVSFMKSCDKPFCKKQLRDALNISQPTAAKLIMQKMLSKELQQHYIPHSITRWYKKTR